jgi:oxygen-independent coproporphyrinogen-3 oxidase
VSAYNLNYEEDTAYFERLSQGLYREDPDRDADMFFATVDRLSAAGYAPYEISNYAKPGHESAHNAAYWAGEDYLGLGPGAVSTLHRSRWKNLPDTERYMATVTEGFLPQVDAEQLTESEWLTERIALELRRREGLSLDRISHVPSDTLNHLAEIGHIMVTNHRLVLTPSGRALADSIAAQLLP